MGNRRAATQSGPVADTQVRGARRTAQRGSAGGYLLKQKGGEEGNRRGAQGAVGEGEKGLGAKETREKTSWSC